MYCIVVNTYTKNVFLYLVQISLYYGHMKTKRLLLDPISLHHTQFDKIIHFCLGRIFYKSCVQRLCALSHCLTIGYLQSNLILHAIIRFLSYWCRLTITHSHGDKLRKCWDRLWNVEKGFCKNYLLKLHVFGRVSSLIHWPTCLA